MLAEAFAALIWSAAGAGEGDLLSSSPLYSSAAGGCAGVSEEGAATGEVLGGGSEGASAAVSAADGADAVGGWEIGECASW